MEQPVVQAREILLIMYLLKLGTSVQVVTLAALILLALVVALVLRAELLQLLDQLWFMISQRTRFRVEQPLLLM